mmetsp:Transcript_41970/g.102906  ORF Transcript_41970/g.102906 Transcript_41970/m.102906 type:complete len:266 (+) Transcript_41970:730-1527(+)
MPDTHLGCLDVAEVAADEECVFPALSTGLPVGLVLVQLGKVHETVRLPPHVADLLAQSDASLKAHDTHRGLPPHNPHKIKHLRHALTATQLLVQVVRELKLGLPLLQLRLCMMKLPLNSQALRHAKSVAMPLTCLKALPELPTSCLKVRASHALPGRAVRIDDVELCELALVLRKPLHVLSGQADLLGLRIAVERPLPLPRARVRMPQLPDALSKRIRIKKYLCPSQECRLCVLIPRCNKLLDGGVPVAGERADVRKDDLCAAPC